MEPIDYLNAKLIVRVGGTDHETPIALNSEMIQYVFNFYEKEGKVQLFARGSLLDELTGIDFEEIEIPDTISYSDATATDNNSKLSMH